jgi:integrase
MLTAGALLALLRKIIGRGVVRQAVAAFNDITQMLHWGEKRQPWRGLLSEGNPADLVDMGTLLPNDYEEERDRVLSPAEIRELAEILTSTASNYEASPAGTKYQAIRPLKRESELALWICLGTLCRIGELLMAEWKHVDLIGKTWFIPKANVKGRRNKKQDHYIFLSDFALVQFSELNKITGKSKWVFPAKNKAGMETHVCLKTVTKQVGDRQSRFKQGDKPLAGRCHDDTLVLADGANGKWTPHDLRRTGATMMQQLGIPLDIIDRCQNHVLAGSKVRRHYLHHDYREEKTEAWNKLGNKIGSILESA